MPASGPNCDYAALEGAEAYKGIALMLKSLYDIPTLEELEKQDPKTRPYYKTTLESHLKARKAIQELFVSDACDTW